MSNKKARKRKQCDPPWCKCGLQMFYTLKVVRACCVGLCTPFFHELSQCGRRIPEILSPLRPSSTLSPQCFACWWMSCWTGWTLETFWCSPVHRNIFLQLSDSICYHFALQMTLPSQQPDQTSPRGCELCVKLSWTGLGHWSGPFMLVNHSPASQPKTSTMLLLTAIQFRKKAKRADRHGSSTSTSAEVAIMGQGGDVPCEHLPPSCYAMQTARSVLH